MASKDGFQIVHVFPNSARLSCGPCDAIMAFMESQRECGLEVRAISPADDTVAPERRRPIEHLPIQEFNLDRADFSSMVGERSGGDQEIFHFHGLSPWSDRLAECLKNASTPYVFTSHGQLHFRGLVHGIKKFAYLNFLNPFIRDAAGLHFLTHREKERSRYILPFWRKKVLVQPNLVRLPERDSIIPASREQLGIPANAFVFAYLGRLDVRHKGLDFLVEAFARIAHDNEAHLLMIGPDFAGGRQVLEELVRKLGCEKKVHFTGPKIGPVKWEFLKAADAFVSPSRWEAFSIAMAEAIGFGLPTIVSDGINSASEMAAARAAVTSRLSARPLAAAMSQVMADQNLRRSLADNGHQWVVNTCSFSTAGPRFAEFYRSLL
jgi:glycosyltransferase involved in cell wall biosynthesis